MKVRITFCRNRDNLTRKYNIYRSRDKYMDSNAQLIMTVEQPEENRIERTNEIMERAPGSNKVFRSKHGQWLDNPVVRINGNPVDIPYSVNRELGEIYFAYDVDETAVVTVSYVFDGIEVYDSVEEQNFVTYYGPPLDISSSTGSTYYYRIEAVDDEGNRSQLSDPVSISF